MKFPSPLVKPIARLGASFVNRNPYFRERLALLDGESVALEVRGFSKPLVFTIVGDKLSGPLRLQGEAGVKVSARPKVFWDILWGRVDPDAAFFQRKIEVKGRLATALVLKNALDDLVR